MITKTRFSQAQSDKLEMRKAKAILAVRKAQEELRKARQALREYDKTHPYSSRR